MAVEDAGTPFPLIGAKGRMEDMSLLHVPIFLFLRPATHGGGFRHFENGPYFFGVVKMKRLAFANCIV